MCACYVMICELFGSYACDDLMFFCFFFFKQKTAYEMLRSLVGSEMCIRDRYYLFELAHLQ